MTVLLISVSIAINLISFTANALQLIVVAWRKELQNAFSIVTSSLAVTNLLTTGLTAGFSVVFLLHKTAGLDVKEINFYAWFLVLYVRDFALTLSMFHVVLIATQRFCAVFYPLRFRQIVSRKICLYSLLIIWAINGVIYGCLLAMSMELRRLINGITILVFGVTIIIAYALIWWKILNSKKFMNTPTVHQETQKSNRRILLHAVLVSISFILLTFPYVFIFLILNITMDALLVVASLLIQLKMLLDPMLYYFVKCCKKKRSVMGRAQANTANSNILPVRKKKPSTSINDEVTTKTGKQGPVNDTSTSAASNECIL